MFHPSDHFFGPPLDLLQQAHVLLVLRAAYLDTRLQVGFSPFKVSPEQFQKQLTVFTNSQAYLKCKESYFSFLKCYLVQSAFSRREKRPHYVDKYQIFIFYVFFQELFVGRWSVSKEFALHKMSGLQVLSFFIFYIKMNYVSRKGFKLSVFIKLIMWEKLSIKANLSPVNNENAQ